MTSLTTFFLHKKGKLGGASIFKCLTRRGVLFILAVKQKGEEEEGNRQWFNDQFLMEKGGDYECLMDCQYEYVLIDPFDHHGFLSYHPGERIDPLAEKRVRSLQ